MICLYITFGGNLQPVLIKIDTLRVHPILEEIYTPTEEQIENLKKSIKRKGLLVDIEVVIIEGIIYIISGYLRFLALKELGVKEVNVKMKTIPENDIPLYIITYNQQRVKTAREIRSEAKTLEKYYSKGKGHRNDKDEKKGTCADTRTGCDRPRPKTREKIADALGESGDKIQKLKRIDNIDTTLIDRIGKKFNGREYTLDRAYKDARKIVEEQKFEKLSKEKFIPLPTSLPIHLFDKNSNDLRGDIKTGQIHTVVTSPPYFDKENVDYGYTKGLGREKTPEEYIENLVKHFKETVRVVNDKGSIFLIMGDSYSKKEGWLLIPQLVVMSLRQEYGLILKDVMTWHKTNPIPTGCKDRLSPTTETVFRLVKSNDATFNDVKTLSISNPFSEGKNIGDYLTEDIIETAVCTYQDSEIKHPCPFPKELATILILLTTKPGDHVLDPFMGSGTVGNVCRALSERWVVMGRYRFK